jgi:hypothetical protein
VGADQAHVIPTFAIAYTWHLRVFAPRYAALAMYRENVLPALGLSSMLVQAVIFGLMYLTMIAPLAGGYFFKAVSYTALGFFLSWSFSTLAVAGKSRMSSIQDFVIIESGFTAIQWLVVGFLTVAVA